VVRRNCAKLIMSWEVQTLGHSFLDFGDLQFRFWLIWLTIQLIIFKFIKAKKTFRSSCNQALFLSKMPSFIGTFLYAHTDFFDVKTNLLLGCGIFRRPSNGWVFPRPETHLNCFTCAFNFLREGAVIGEIGDLPVLERRFRQELSPIVNRCTQEPVWWLVDWLLSFRGVLSPTQKGVNRDKRGLRRYGLYLIHAHLILWFLIVSFDCEAVSEHYPLQTGGIWTKFATFTSPPLMSNTIPKQVKTILFASQIPPIRLLLNFKYPAFKSSSFLFPRW
jgi:hypothetical protein